jgi:antitoxin component YwqK of YwqJK toxin-antitoxin module
MIRLLNVLLFFSIAIPTLILLVGIFGFFYGVEIARGWHNLNYEYLTNVSYYLFIIKLYSPAILINLFKKGIGKKDYWNPKLITLAIALILLMVPFNGKMKYYINERQVPLSVWERRNNNGIYKSFYPNHKLELVMTIMNGQPNGLSTYYLENGNVSYMIPHLNGKQNGVSKKYYANGKLESEGKLVNNEAEGVWIRYYENGNKESMEHFSHGIENGYAKYFYWNGALKSEGYYVNGQPVGKWGTHSK